MSTYQGARYVVEQLRSILDQLPPGGRIVVRDDGSTDGTPNTILALNDGRITLTRGPNIGFARSFLTLLAEAPEDTDMVMLADQDDVWLPHKIQRAWDHLAPLAGAPALYCSRLQLVDAQLRPIGLTPLRKRPPSFQNALAENIVTGCTAAMNPAAVKLVCQCGDVALIHFHDWWCYLVVAAFGTVVYDPKPSVLYRQHGGNVIGMGSGWGRYLANVRFIRKTSWVQIMYRQIGNFLGVFGTRLGTAQQLLITSYFHPQKPKTVWLLTLSLRRYRQTFLDEILFRVLVLVELVLGRRLPAK
ncbi:MAG: glycosyltransferase family 2 protein [Pseudomonadota bacterium]